MKNGTIVGYVFIELYIFAQPYCDFMSEVSTLDMQCLHHLIRTKGII